MALTELVVITFIDYYLEEHPDSRRERTSLADDTAHIKCSGLVRRRNRKIVKSLAMIAEEFDRFLSETSSFEENFDRLVRSWAGDGVYDDIWGRALWDVADRFFHRGTSWERIVSYLVFCSELDLKSRKFLVNEEEVSRMRSQLINSTYAYFDEYIMPWIDHQEGGWFNVTSHDGTGLNFNNRILFKDAPAKVPSNGRGMRQVVNVTCVAAAILGGLYFCSKFSLQ